MSYPQHLSCAEMQLRTARAFETAGSVPRSCESLSPRPALLGKKAADHACGAPQIGAPLPRLSKRERKKAEHHQYIQNKLLAEYDQPRVQLAQTVLDDGCSSAPPGLLAEHDLQPTWALPLTAWVEQRHALGDLQIHATGAEIRTSAYGYGNGAARASSHLKLPQQAAEHAAAAHGGCEQHALNRVQRGATGGPFAPSATEDPN